MTSSLVYCCSIFVFSHCVVLDDRNVVIELFRSRQSAIDNISNIYIKYTNTYADSIDLNHALSRKFIRKHATGDFSFAKSDSVIALKVTDATKNASQVVKQQLTKIDGLPNVMMGQPVYVSPCEYLADDTFSLNYSDRDRNANMRGHSRPPILDWLPFGCFTSMQCDDAGVDALYAVENNGNIIKLTNQSVDNVNYLIVTVQSGDLKRDATVREYWFDPARGTTLVRAVLNYESKVVMHYEYPELHQLSNGSWIPKRTIRMMRQPQMNHWETLDIQITEINTEQKPPKEMFEIVMKAGTGVLDFDEQIVRALRIRKTERVGVQDLRRLYEMIGESRKDPLMDTAIHRPNPYRWVWWAIAGFGSLSLVFAGIRLIRRRRRFGVSSV